MSTDISKLLKREFQLNLLAYIVIVSLVAASGVLAFMVITGVQMPDFWLLRDQTFQTLTTGFLLMIILYLADQHRRLRDRVSQAHAELEEARLSIAAAYDRLAFSHHAAEVMTSLAEEDGLRVVLAESMAHFGADAAAVVGDDITITTREGVGAQEAQAAVLQVALESVRAGSPLTTASDERGSTALAVPLRIKGQLKSVVALWRRENDFSIGELEGLGLVARIIELGMENRLLLDDVRSQLSGTIKAMVDLVEQRRPNYIPHSTRVATYAVAVGRQLGLREDECAELRLAAMLQDIGMLEVPESIISAPRGLTAEEQSEIRKHAEKGAGLSKVANFSVRVQDAIMSHHERLDGTGYPNGIAGEQIPLAARILAVCDSYVAMTSDRPHRPKMSAINALNELRSSAGTAYDSRIVREFIKVQAEALTEETPRLDAVPALASVARQLSAARRPA